MFSCLMRSSPALRRNLSRPRQLNPIVFAGFSKQANVLDMLSLGLRFSCVHAPCLIFFRDKTELVCVGSPLKTPTHPPPLWPLRLHCCMHQAEVEKFITGDPLTPCVIGFYDEDTDGAVSTCLLSLCTRCVVADVPVCVCVFMPGSSLRNQVVRGVVSIGSFLSRLEARLFLAML